MVLHRRPLQTQRSGRTLVVTTIPYTFSEQTQRYEGKGTYSLDANHRFQAAFIEDHREAGQQHVQNPTTVDGPEQPVRRASSRRICSPLNYSGVLTPNLRSSKAATRRATRRSTDVGATVHRPHRRHAAHRQRKRPPLLVADLLRRLRRRKQRDNQDVFVKGIVLPVDRGTGSHNMVVRVRQLQRPARSRTTTSRAATTASSARPRFVQGTRRLTPQFLARRHDASSSGTRSSLDSRRHELPDALAVLQRQLARRRAG